MSKFYHSGQEIAFSQPQIRQVHFLGTRGTSRLSTDLKIRGLATSSHGRVGDSTFVQYKLLLCEILANEKDQMHATTFRGLCNLPRQSPMVSGEILLTGTAQGSNKSAAPTIASFVLKLIQDPFQHKKSSQSNVVFTCRSRLFA